MSFLSGGVRGHQDPGLKEANRRSRLHLARDINDEHALATDAEPPQTRRHRGWVVLGIAVLALGVLAVIGPRGRDAVQMTASCTSPAIAVAPGPVGAGDPLRYRVTGPDDAAYVVTLDGAPVQGDAGSLVDYTQTDAGPAFRLRQCLSPVLAVAAPAVGGPHRLALLSTGPGGGTAREVAATTVTVTP